MKKIILLTIIFSSLLITGCSGNSFKSCHERCIAFEVLKVNETCEPLVRYGRALVEKCGLDLNTSITIQESCFDRCINFQNTK